MADSLNLDTLAPPPITAPGWYRDPAPDAPVFGRRYWDGSSWTIDVSPASPAGGASLPPSEPRVIATPHFSYYAQSIDRRVTPEVLDVQRRGDEAFLSDLARVQLPARATAAQETLITDRKRYDQTLGAGASALRAGNQADFALVVPLFTQQRDASSRDLDALRSALGFPANTCSFLAP